MHLHWLYLKNDLMLKNKVILLLVVYLAPFVLFAQTAPYDMVSQMGRGINLGNVLSAPIEGNWAPAAEEQYFIDVAAAGFTNVRIPIDFFGTRTTGDTSGYSSTAGTAGNYTGTSADYVVSSVYLDRVQQVVNWSLNQGLVTIIDLHGSTLNSEFIFTFNDGESEYTHPTSAKRAADNDKFRAIWAQVADRFKNHPDNLLFEVINEPYFHMSKTDMDTLNTDILAIIRASGGSNGTRNVIITGGTETSHQAPLQIEPSIISGDSYLIATFHYYQPFNFTSSSADSRDNESWGTVQDKELLTTRFNEVYQWALTNQIPVFLGEFSADNTGGYNYSTGDLNTISDNTTGFADGGPDNASRVEYHRFIVEQAINKGFSFAAWDSGPKSNKTINKRTDSPTTLNYNINDFSVTSYNPKVTTISTVVDNSTWVEDVKDALLDTSANCNNFIQLIINPNFECGFNSNWDISVAGASSAAATFSDGTTDSRSGNVSGKIDVTASANYNSVLLINQEYTNDLTGKTLTVKAYVKASTVAQTFKFRIKAVVDGSNVFSVSPSINLSTDYPTSPFEFEYVVAANTTSIEVQTMLGNEIGIYYFDDFEVSGNSCSSTTIWDGAAWSNEAPDANSYAIISGPYTTGINGDISACVMKVDAGITIDGATDTAIGEVLVMAGNTLTIDQTSSLTVSGDFTNSGGTVSLNSTEDDFSSLIVTGTATGNIVYNRYVNVYDDGNSGGWDLVGAPVGMSIADFITANGDNIEELVDNYAFAQYNNASGQWERYATDNSDTGNLTSGQGYAMATTAGATVAFTGAMQTIDQTINIINNDGLNNVGRRWNLVSNPFPSYIVGYDGTENPTNFLYANTTAIDSEFLSVYGWNGSDYTIYNNMTRPAGFSIAPGQGFWVAAASTDAAQLDFTADLRTTSGTGDFVAGPQPLVYKLELKLFNGESQQAATKLYFRDGLSLDLDPGYDAGAFNQLTKLSTRLPQGRQETAFSINAMGMDAMQNTRVPLEIRQNAGQEFTISIADMELPQDIYVYLEDTLNGTLTSLKDGDFELTAQSNLSGLDRFFIVFKSNSVLSNGDAFGINALNVYKANTDSFVTIAGITPELGQLNATIFNILGMTVREKALNPATATQTISTQGLVSGLYIIQLKSGNQVFIKKMILC
jgi:endoglucanase